MENNADLSQLKHYSSYGELKDMLSDWAINTAIAVNPIEERAAKLVELDETVSISSLDLYNNWTVETEDQKNLLLDLAIIIEIFSARHGMRLDLDRLKDRFSLWEPVVDKVFGDHDIELISKALTTGASMGEFEEWTSGGLGDSLIELTGSRLGDDWSCKFDKKIFKKDKSVAKLWKWGIDQLSYGRFDRYPD
ncbi:MAG: hypothetical protein ACK6BG_00580 [Cyanobacteriota bacterium]